MCFSRVLLRIIAACLWGQIIHKSRAAQLIFPQLSERDRAILKMREAPTECKAKANQALPQSPPENVLACNSLCSLHCVALKLSWIIWMSNATKFKCLEVLWCSTRTNHKQRVLQDCVCTTKHFSSFNRLEVHGRLRMHEEKKSSVEVANVNCPTSSQMFMKVSLCAISFHVARDNFPPITASNRSFRNCQLTGKKTRYPPPRAETTKMRNVTGQMERHLRAMNLSPIHHAGTMNVVLVFRRCTAVGQMNTLFLLKVLAKTVQPCKRALKKTTTTTTVVNIRAGLLRLSFAIHLWVHTAQAHLFEVLLQVTLTGRGTGAAPACSRHQKLHICKQGIYSQHSTGSVMTETPTQKETALIPLGRLWEVSIDANQGWRDIQG